MIKNIDDATTKAVIKLGIAARLKAALKLCGIMQYSRVCGKADRSGVDSDDDVTLFLAIFDRVKLR